MQASPPGSGSLCSLSNLCLPNKKWVDVALIIGSLGFIALGLTAFYQVGALELMAHASYFAYGAWGAAALLVVTEIVWRVKTYRAQKPEVFTLQREPIDESRKKFFRCVDAHTNLIGDYIRYEFDSSWTLGQVRTGFAQQLNNSKAYLGYPLVRCQNLDPQDLHLCFWRRTDELEWMTFGNDHKTMEELEEHYHFLDKPICVRAFFQNTNSSEKCAVNINTLLPENKEWDDIRKVSGLEKMRLFEARLAIFCTRISSTMNRKSIQQIQVQLLHMQSQFMKINQSDDIETVEYVCGLYDEILKLYDMAEKKSQEIENGIDGTLWRLRTTLEQQLPPPLNPIHSDFTISFQDEHYHCQRTVIEAHCQGLLKEGFKEGMETSLRLNPEAYTDCISEVHYVLSFLAGKSSAEKFFWELRDDSQAVYQLLILASQLQVPRLFLLGQQFLIEKILSEEIDGFSLQELEHHGLHLLAQIVRLVGTDELEESNARLREKILEAPMPRQLTERERFRCIFTHVHEMHDHLFLGDFAAYLSIETPITGEENYGDCSNKEIQLVISITKQPGPEPQVKRIPIIVEDEAESWPAIYSRFQEVFQEIDASRARGENILIHCTQGMSRSATVLCAYLMYSCRVTRDQAFNYMHSIRPIVDISNFENELLEYQEELKI